MLAASLLVVATNIHVGQRKAFFYDGALLHLRSGVLDIGTFSSDIQVMI